MHVFTATVDGSSLEHVVYGLTGVVVHAGTSSDGGHYYCYARRGLPRSPDIGSSLLTKWKQSSTLGGSSGTEPTRSIVGGSEEDVFLDDWFLFNDEHISKTSFEQVLIP